MRFPVSPISDPRARRLRERAMLRQGIGLDTLFYFVIALAVVVGMAWVWWE